MRFAAGRWIGAFGVFGILVVGIANYGMTSAWSAPSNTDSFLSLFGANLAASGAAAAVGALLGFIFGIPRTLDPASRAAVAGAATQAGPSAVSNVVFASNTNLERISDWLTTLLIGATLVQIKDIIGWIGGLGMQLAAGAITNQTLVPIIVVYFFALSFLGVYVITRLYLTTALTQTLGLLSGTVGGAAELGALNAKLLTAANSPDPSEFYAANSLFKNWPLPDEQKADATLNASLARVLASYLKSGAGQKSAEMQELLKTAVRNSLTDPAQKSRFMADLTSGALKTGDNVFDTDLAKLVV